MLFQQLINGLCLGAVYALISVGYTMVYGIIELINFAHGEIFMMGAFLTLSGMHVGLPLPIAALLGVAGATMLGVTIERVAYRPLRHSPRITALISALGVSIFLQNLAQVLWSAKKQPMLTGPSWLEEKVSLTLPLLGNAVVAHIQIVIILCALGLMVAMEGVVERTSIGRAMRCCAQDQTAARLMGVNVDRVISFTFAVGSATGAVAGILVALNYNTLYPTMGFVAGIKAFAAAVLGGIGNIRGAFLGGIILGLLEGLAGGYLWSQWMDAVAFSVLIAVLVFRPSGLLGTHLPDRA